MTTYLGIVHASSTLYEEFLESIFKFPHLLIKGLIKGLSYILAIFSTFSIEIYYSIAHNDSKQ